MKSQNVQLSFCGQKVNLKSDSDPDLIQEAIDIATLRLVDAEKRCAGVSAHQVALLALLDLSEEYVKAKNRFLVHKKKLLEKHAEIFSVLDPRKK